MHRLSLRQEEDPTVKVLPVMVGVRCMSTWFQASPSLQGELCLSFGRGCELSAPAHGRMSYIVQISVPYCTRGGNGVGEGRGRNP